MGFTKKSFHMSELQVFLENSEEKGEEINFTDRMYGHLQKNSVQDLQSEEVWIKKV